MFGKELRNEDPIKYQPLKTISLEEDLRESIGT